MGVGHRHRHDACLPALVRGLESYPDTSLPTLDAQAH